jgi:hypothetical protein
MNIMNQMFSDIPADTASKLSLEHVVFTDLTLVCVKEKCKSLYSNIIF